MKFVVFVLDGRGLSVEDSALFAPDNRDVPWLGARMFVYGGTMRRWSSGLSWLRLERESSGPRRTNICRELGFETFLSFVLEDACFQLLQFRFVGGILRCRILSTGRIKKEKKKKE